MTEITIKRTEVDLLDWQRLTVLKIKSQFRAHGVESFYMKLMRQYWPDDYEKRTQMEPVYNVWNLKNYDENIVARLQKVIENLKAS